MTELKQAAISFDEFVAQAQAEGWSRKQSRGEIFQRGGEALWARKDEIMLALGFATTDQTAVAQQAAAEAAKKQAAEEQAARLVEGQAKAAAALAERETAERKSREEAAAARNTAKAAITDGAIIWCDAAENTVIRVVNSYGKQRKFDNGGFRIGLVSGEFQSRCFNTVCPDQFAGECFAVLKAVELAAECGLKTCTIRNDRIGGFEASTKRGYIGAKYLWVAKRMAAEKNLQVIFEGCSSAENLADHVSRTEA